MQKRFEGSISIHPALNIEEKECLDAFLEKNHIDDYSLPSKWCGWKVTKNGNYLAWDGRLPFIAPEKWLIRIIDDYFSGNGRLATHTLNGRIIVKDPYGENWETVVTMNKISIIIEDEKTPEDYLNESSKELQEVAREIVIEAKSSARLPGFYSVPEKTIKRALIALQQSEGRG